MKKIIISLLVAMLLAFGMTTTAFAAKAGDTVEVAITVSGNPGFGCYTVDLSYDETALELIELSNAGCLSSKNSVFLSNVDDACASFFVTDLNNVTGDGNLFIATFKVKNDAKDGETYVTASFEPNSLANANNEDISMNIAGGSVTIAHDHVYGEWVVEKAATCTVNGSRYRTCTVAGCAEKQTEVITAPGHSLGQWTVATDATCAAEGTQVRKCANCDYSESKVIAKKDHVMGEWKVTKAASCTAEGTEARKCTGCDLTETRAIAKKDHVMGEWKVTKLATCTAEGTEARKCTGCDLTETRSIAKKDHTIGNWTVTKAATCTAEGSETRKCATCDLAETRAIPAKGHNFGDWKVDQNATCTQEGSRSRVCADCGATETETIPALDHAYDHVDYDDVDHWYICDCGATTSREAHDFENSGVCACGYQKPVTEDPKLDNIPKTGDITNTIVSVPLTILAVTACAILVMIFAEKRRSTK